MAERQLDVVIPVFNEIEIIETLHTRVDAACKATGLRYRINYVDDGSSDGTAEWIVENAINKAASPDEAVQLISLSRNFGQPAAIVAGLDSTDAECVVLMDGDLQDPPELITQMIDRWREGAEVVIPQRTARKETFVRGLGFAAFHRLFQFLSESKVPSNTGTFCLMSRNAVVAVCRLPETHRFFPALRAWVGFNVSIILFERQERAGGEPKQNFVRLFRYAMDAIFGNSLKPLRFLTVSGATLCCVSLAAAAWFAAKRVSGVETASLGFTTIACAILGLGGFQLIAAGILGEYIGRIYDEVRRRPSYIVSSATTSEDAQERAFRVISRKAS